ncbi:MAG: thermosome subunit beta [Candidatus Njordarchaeales archaeon]
MAYAPGTAQIPVLILKEDVRRERGKRALHANISAARAIAEIVRSTLGPRGMNKMIVDTLGDIVITNDGATILDELDVAHPAAKLMVQASKAQDNIAGDGTTSAAVLAGALLSQAEKLLDEGIHPILIVNAFKRALEKAKEFLETKLTKTIDIKKDVKLLKRVAISALNSKLPPEVREYFADLAYKAATIVYDEERNYLDMDLISIIQKEGKSLTDSECVAGVVIDKQVVHPEMPKIKRNARIALINQNIEVEKADVTSNVTLRGIEALETLKKKEKEEIEKMVKKLIDLGVDVVFCQRGISDLAQDIMAKNGIMAARRVRRSDMLLLSRATGAKIVNNIEDLTEEDIGFAGLVEQKKVGEDKMIYVMECKNPRAATIVIRGASKHVTDEAERAIKDAIHVLKDVLEDKKVCPGAGATEVALHLMLKDWADKDPSLSGKEKLVIKAYADALLEVPRALIENMGGDIIELEAELLKKNRLEGGEVGIWGFDASEGKVVNIWEAGLIDPLRVKKYVLSTATEAAITILRIDDVIASKPKKEEKEKKKEEEETSESSIGSSFD